MSRPQACLRALREHACSCKSGTARYAKPVQSSSRTRGITSGTLQLNSSRPVPVSIGSRLRRTISSAASGGSSSRSRPASGRRYLFLAGIPLAFLPLTLFGYTFGSSTQPLSPQIYSDQTVSAISKPTPRHALLSVAVPPQSIPLFKEGEGGEAVRRDGSLADQEKGEIVIQHVMIKNPDLQIERPYTPVNDVGQDGELKVVVKRVKGGEVGRMIHLLKPGGQVGVRGPITTFSLVPSAYDKIVMISTGTGIAPFLQLLAKMPPAPAGSSSPSLHLIHSEVTASQSKGVPNSQPTPTPETSALPLNSLANDSSLDFTSEPSLLPRMQSRHPSLTITRPPPGNIPRSAIEEALTGSRDGQRVLVLVCLPPSMMRPLCGNLTINLQQGPITGLLGEMGLTNREVWKLE